MAKIGQHSTSDTSSGFRSETKIFHSLRPSATLPPVTETLSVTDFAFRLLYSSPASSPSPTTPFLIDSVSGHVITFPDFIERTKSLSSFLQTSFPSVSKNDAVLVISPLTIDLPVLYFSLLSLGVTVCPINPLATPFELTRMIQVANPVIAFTTSHLAPKIPKLKFPTVLLDSSRFNSITSLSRNPFREVRVEQSDRAAILFSSGTTGRVKGVDLTHRNLIASLGMHHHALEKSEVARGRSFFSVPLFHSLGFDFLLRAAAVGETLVMMTAVRVDFEKMLQAIERFKVTHIPAAPPLVVMLGKSPVVTRYDFSALRDVGCGGAPLGKEAMEAFALRFPGVELYQGYGLTEAGPVSRMTEPIETRRYTSVGRLSGNLEAKIVDHTTGEALSPNERGELWLRGPTIMRGYVGDDEATAATLDRDGWLKTGDLCYIDLDGFLYVVDRLKELIKYKAYQVPPAELENLLHGHPEIADAAVVPYPDEVAGQIPMAFVVKKTESNITATQVMDFIAKRVSPYKKIRRVAFINDIPKSPAGKILRRELINLAVSVASSKL